jgi:hypothetical protein
LPKFVILAKGQKTFVAIDGGCCDGILHVAKFKNSGEKVPLQKTQHRHMKPMRPR